MKKILKNQYIRYSLILIGGILLGWIFFHSSPAKVEQYNHAAEAAKSEIWTCAMHPQIRMHEPGKCPICAMDLIPLTQSGTAGMDPASVHLTKEAAQLANVLTTVVSRQNPVKEVRLYGKVQADERLLQNQVAYISGRVEKLLVNFTGEPVRKGQPLALIYSPELVTAQQELLEAAKTKLAQPEIYEAAKEKLRQWKLAEAQISSIEKSGITMANIEIESTTAGIVTARRVNNGDFVSPGSVLYEVSDLSRVWVLFDGYESDLPFLKNGDKIDFTIQALPGSTFAGTIKFIDPVIDPVTRVAKVRIEMSNPGAKLKPEMFATGMLKANLDEYRNMLVIPASAVLWTGKRSVVYVKQPGKEFVFKIREIGLGPKLGNSYVITDGLANGEEIVTEGAFSVDAAAQLEGKPSMMNPEGGKVSSMPGMDMPGDNKAGDTKSLPDKDKPGDTKSTDSKNMPGMDMSDAPKPNSNASPTGINKAQTLQHKMFGVSGNCDLCKERIETAAKSVAGVISAEWNISEKMLHVQFDATKTNSDAIQKAIANIGHDTEKFKAPDNVYKRLPECCLYRK
jgi:Cu(I)/Ag(I) efflux system membrane fusion protein